MLFTITIASLEILDVAIRDICKINMNSDAAKVISFDFIHVSTFRIYIYILFVIKL